MSTSVTTSVPLGRHVPRAAGTHRRPLRLVALQAIAALIATSGIAAGLVGRHVESRHQHAAAATRAVRVIAPASRLVLRVSDLPHGFALDRARSGAVSLASLRAVTDPAWYRVLARSHRESEWQASFGVPQLLDLRDATPYGDTSLLAVGQVVTVWKSARDARGAFDSPLNPLARLLASQTPLVPARLGDESEAASTTTSGMRSVTVHFRIANVTETVTVVGAARELTQARAYDVARRAAGRALVAAGRSAAARAPAPQTAVAPASPGMLALYS